MDRKYFLSFFKTLSSEVIAKLHLKALFRYFEGSFLQVRQVVVHYDAKHLEGNASKERKVAKASFAITSSILFLVTIFLCIQYYIGREITASNNSFKDTHWTTEKQYFIELEQLDGIFFHIAINGVTDKNDELFIEIKNAKEDKRYVIKLEKPRNKHQCYYRLYFSTIIQCEKLPQNTYICPGKYTFHIECKNHEERIMKEGELLIGYFCKIKYLRYYKKQQIPYLRVREINNNNTPIQVFSKDNCF